MNGENYFRVGRYSFEFVWRIVLANTGELKRLVKDVRANLQEPDPFALGHCLSCDEEISAILTEVRGNFEDPVALAPVDSEVLVLPGDNGTQSDWTRNFPDGKKKPVIFGCVITI